MRSRDAYMTTHPAHRQWDCHPLHDLSNTLIVLGMMDDWSGVMICEMTSTINNRVSLRKLIPQENGQSWSHGRSG